MATYLSSSTLLTSPVIALPVSASCCVVGAPRRVIKAGPPGDGAELGDKNATQRSTIETHHQPGATTGLRRP